ncbi:PAS domain S-box protein, partial [Candidatus Aerophobetes bacterium]
TYSLIEDAEGNPKNIIAVLRDITETKKLISELGEAKATLEDRAKERTANLTALQEISTVLARATGLNETLALILECLEKKLGYIFTAMILVNREKNCLDNYMLGPSVPVEKMAKMVGLDLARTSVSLTAKENMLVQTVLTGKPQFTHDLSDYSRPVVGKHLIAPVQKMLGIKLVGAIPLTTDEEVVGVLSFARKTEEPLTEEEMGVLMTFTNQAGLAVERAKAYRDLEESTKALEEAKNYTDSIIKSITDTLIVVSPEGSIQTVNHATCVMLGYEEKELVGQPVGKILAEEEEEEVSLFKGSGLDDLIKKKFISNVEKTYLAKDGRKIPVRFSGSVMREADGKIQGIVCMAQDITEHKEAEKQSLQSEKLAGIGLLASSIAHELGNPLSIMSSTLQYIRDALLNRGNRQLIEAIDTTVDSIGEMHELLGNLSGFTGSQRPHFESTDLRRILSRILSFIHKEAEIHKIKAYHLFDENLPNCQVDPGEIKQLFLNLFKNAIEAMPNGGELHVRMHLLDSKDAVRIEVSDTGHGISETDLRSIFRPFYSTKSDGTGLGLSFCRHVVEEHGGEITVKSDLGKGSTFSVILPLRQKGTDKSEE